MHWNPMGRNTKSQKQHTWFSGQITLWVKKGLRKIKSSIEPLKRKEKRRKGRKPMVVRLLVQKWIIRSEGIFTKGWWTRIWKPYRKIWWKTWRGSSPGLEMQVANELGFLRHLLLKRITCLQFKCSKLLKIIKKSEWRLKKRKTNDIQFFQLQKRRFSSITRNNFKALKIRNSKESTLISILSISTMLDTIWGRVSSREFRTKKKIEKR